MRDFIKNINSTDYPDVTKQVYIMLSKDLGYTARITMIWEVLLKISGLSEFTILDQSTQMNGSFDSFIMDELINWYNGKDVNFGEISDAIFKVGDFTQTEKMILEPGLEEKLWAFFLVIKDPSLKFN